MVECINCSLETAMSIVFENVEKVTIVNNNNVTLSFFKMDIMSIPFASYNIKDMRLLINI